MGDSEFRKDLQALMNRHSMENGCNTPDFILAEYLDRCLAAFDLAVNARETWYGRPPTIVASPLPTNCNEAGSHE
jgi:hypothetical protein